MIRMPRTKRRISSTRVSHVTVSPVLLSVCQRELSAIRLQRAYRRSVAYTRGFVLL